MENNEQMPAEVSEEAKPLKRGSKKMRTVVSAIVLLLVIVGGVAGVMWEVTVKHANGAAIRKISELLPIPAARVGGKTILYREYLKSRDTLNTFLNSEAAKTQGINTKLDTDMEKNVLEKLVNQAALEELSGTYHTFRQGGPYPILLALRRGLCNQRKRARVFGCGTPVAWGRRSRVRHPAVRAHLCKAFPVV